MNAVASPLTGQMGQGAVTQSETRLHEATYTYGHSQVVTAVHGARTAGKEAAFFLPYLRPGMRLIDVGCGPGTITVGLAREVAPGRVVGLDFAPAVLDQACRNASDQGVPTVTFLAGRADCLPFPGGWFDAVFAHTLLEHVADPAAVLREARRVLKPGGLLGMRDCDWGSGTFWPADSSVELAASLYARVWQHNGGHPNCGRRLRALLRAAGFTGIRTSASFRWDGSQDGSPSDSRSFGELLAQRLRLPNFAEPIRAMGWADTSLLEQTAEGCAAWSYAPDAFATMVMVEAVGWAG